MNECILRLLHMSTVTDTKSAFSKCRLKATFFNSTSEGIREATVDLATGVYFESTTDTK